MTKHERVPGTQKSPLEKITEALSEEVDKWNGLGMSMNGIQHTTEAIYATKMQVQTLINVLMEKEIFTNEEFNIEFKRLLLEDMKRIREENEPEVREAQRRRIVEGSGIAVPEVRLLGPDGKELKL